MKNITPNFQDFRITQWLVWRFGKKNFASLVDQEFSQNYQNCFPAEEAFFLGKLSQKSNSQKEVSELWLDKISALEHKISEILWDMEMTGVSFDAEKMKHLQVKIRSDIKKLETEIWDIMGERINLNSPKQLQVYFFEKLGLKPIKKNKTGFSVDTDVLEELAQKLNIKEAGLILEYRKLSKLSSTYVDGLLKAIDLRDGKIHTSYDSLGTTTGRMSSNDPNLQNIPTGDGYPDDIKSCFVPTGDNIFLVADYSQIELRILAFLSQDEALLSAFREGEDIHTRTAKFLFGNKEISSSERRIAKTVNFGVIYGITGFGLAKTLDCSPWEAKKYINAFYEKYPKVREYYDKILENWRKDGFVETFFKRKRFVPGLNDANKTIRAIAEREAMNMPIQGTAADILKGAMCQIYDEIQKNHLAGKMILQVHDELVFDIPKSEQQIFEKIVKESMENFLYYQDLYPIDKDMEVPPLIADIGYGKNWKEAK